MLAAKCNEQASFEGFTVNYVWLSPRDRKKDLEGYATRMPLHYLLRMHDNASRYNGAKFNLWIDFEQIDPVDRFFIASHQYIFDLSQINIRNLRDIPAYAEAPGFDKDSNIALYARADYARVLVLNHFLHEAEEEQTIIYSDLDCEDISLGKPQAEECWQKYGLVFGHAGSNTACNGYIGLRGGAAKVFMNDYLLPRTTAAFQKNLTNHYGAFSKAITKYRNAHLPGLNRAAFGRVELPFMRTLMPYDEDVYEGVCPPRKTRVPGSKELI